MDADCRLLLASLLVLALSPSDSAALECMHSRGFVDVPYKATVPCASFHLVCIEMLYRLPDSSELEYKAECGKGDECHNQTASDCLACQGDRCNTALVARIQAQNLQCFTFDGDVKQADFVDLNSNTFGSMHIPRVKEKPAYCDHNVSQCHRVKFKKADTNGATAAQNAAYGINDIFIRGGCGNVTCDQWGPFINCLNCEEKLCNSLATIPTIVTRNTHSDDAGVKAGVPTVTGVPGGGLVTVTVTAVSAAVSVAMATLG